MKKVRGKKTKSGNIEITKETLSLLQLIGLCNVISIKQITREKIYSSADLTRRRVRKLLDNDLVRVHILAYNKPSLVSLTPKGLNIVLDHYPELNGRVRTSGVINYSSLNHRLAVVDTRLYITNLCTKDSLNLLRWSNSRGDLVRELGLPEFKLTPDGVAEVQNGKNQPPICIGIEADQGTEGTRVLQGKLNRYVKIFQANLFAELWWIVDAGIRRRQTIAKLTVQAGLSQVARVMERKYITQRPVKSPQPRLSVAMQADNSLNMGNCDDG